MAPGTKGRIRGRSHLLRHQAVRQLEPFMGGEDFADYLQKLPGTFFYVGGGNEENGVTFPHHHQRFDVEERSMPVAGKVFRQPFSTS